MERSTYLKKAVIYQMFLRAFDARGTIAAATERLPELADLGVDIIYLCPFVVHDPSQDVRNFSERMKKSGLEKPRNPYRLSDYFRIDPEYGNDDDFERFVREAHALGMRVMPDLVYLHCGPNAAFLTDHPEFAQRDEHGEIRLTEFGFPILDFSQPKLREYLWENMLYFVRRFDVDGYRCDCGDQVPLDFWEEGVRRIRAIRPDFIMLNEGNQSDALREAFDLNYGSSWIYWLNQHLRGEAGAERVRDAFRRLASDDCAECRNILAVENHDYVNDAYDNRLEKSVPCGAMEGAFLLSAFLPGVPFLYNGEELGDSTRHSIMGCRFNAPGLCVDRSRSHTPEAEQRRAFLKELYHLRHTLPVIAEGSCRWCAEDTPALAFLRENTDQTLLTAANLTKQTVMIPVPHACDEARVYLQRGAVFDGSSLTLPPDSHCVLLWKKT